MNRPVCRVQFEDVSSYIWVISPANSRTGLSNRNPTWGVFGGVSSCSYLSRVRSPRSPLLLTLPGLVEDVWYPYMVAVPLPILFASWQLTHNVMTLIDPRSPRLCKWLELRNYRDRIHDGRHWFILYWCRLEGSFCGFNGI